MAPHAKDHCPCGSGKRYKHCHQQIDAARRRTLLLAALAVVLVGGTAAVAGPGLVAKWSAQRKAARAGDAADSAARAEVQARPGAMVGTPAANGAAATGVVNPNGVAGPPILDPSALTLKPPNSGDVLPGEHPRDWEYDVAKNRYYDPRPGHMHWHMGPPPTDPNALMPTPQITVTTPDGKPIKVTTTRAASAPTAPSRATGK